MDAITTEQVKALEATHVLQTYKRAPVVFVRGEGSTSVRCRWEVVPRFHLRHRSGRAGSRHAGLADALATQARTLIQTSNLYYHPLQGQLAARLAALSGLQRTFFCNSGTEAVEACLKFARRYWFSKGERHAHTVHRLAPRLFGTDDGRVVGDVESGIPRAVRTADSWCGVRVA